MTRLDLSLAICVWNDAAPLARLLDQAQASRLFAEIVVVDDGSDRPVRAKGARVIRHERRRGIGAARNTAIQAVRGTYLLFIDADDRILSELAYLIRDLGDQPPFDLCLFRHVDSRSAARGLWGQTEADEALWQSAGHAVGALVPVRGGARPVLAQTANYPWNKIFRTGFLRQAAIACPETEVHEDVALHWLSLLRAGRMLVSDRACLWHGFDPEGGRLTNRRDPARMQVFRALDPVAGVLREAGADWQAAFLTWACALFDWAADPLPAGLKTRFRRAESGWLSGVMADWPPPRDPDLAARLAPRLTPPAPVTLGRARMKIALTGPHAVRMPLAYPALASLWQDRIVRVAQPRQADLTLFAHPRDIGSVPEDTGGRPVALFSEEPFWDSLFSPDPLADRVTIAGRRVFQRNHHRSPVFDFDRIPYFLLTDHGFAAAYTDRFLRNAARSAEDWRDLFAARSRTLTFLAERRPEAFHDVTFPEGEVIGLCAWRTRLAQSCVAAEGRGAETLGASWQVGGRQGDGRQGNGGPACGGRLDLPDWHLDKLARLDGRTRMISAIENTHQPAYLSEKLFDAFACGAAPVYFASPSHRIHDLGLPPEAWINLYGLDTPAAAAHLSNWAAEPAFLADFAIAQARLAALLADPQIWLVERRRLARAVVAEVERLICEGPA